MANPRKSTVTNLTTLTAVYNIFITTNKKAAERFSTLRQSRRSSMRKFYDSEKKRDPQAHIFLNTGDANIIDFVHNFNFGKGSGGDNMITLKTFEPGLEVLKRFFFLFLQEELGTLKWRKSFLESKGNAYSQWVKRFQSSSDPDNWDGLDWVGPSDAEPRLDEETENAWREEIADRKEELITYCNSNTIGQKAYISYGVGDNLDEWAGPFQVILGKIDYDNDGRQETITYSFSTDHIARQFKEKGVLSQDPDFSPINFIRPTIPFAAFDYSDTTWEKNWGDYGKGVVTPGYTPSLHDTIVKLISYYLYSLGIKNHIIVLPNLDLLLASQVAQAVGVNDWHQLFNTKKKYTATQGDLLASENYEKNRKGYSSYAAFNTSLSEDAYAKYNLKVAYNIMTRVRKLYTSLFNWEDSKAGIGKELGEWLGLNSDYSFTLRERIDLVMTVFQRIGLRTNKGEQASSDEDPALVNFTDEKAPLIAEGTDNWSPGIDTYDLAPSSQYVVTDPFGGSDPIKADAVINLELPFQHLKSGEIADADGAKYMAPIMQIVNNVVQSGGRSYVNLSYFWENDIKIVNLLKSKFGSGTFEGYRDNLKRKWGATKSPPPVADDDNYFIFGDEELIKLFVYGGYADLINFNKQTRTKAVRAWEGIPFEFNKTTGKGGWAQTFFLDPFWNRIKDDLQQCTQTEDEVAMGIEGTTQRFAGDRLFGTYTDEQKRDLNRRLEDRFQDNVKKSFFYHMKSLVKKPWLDMGHFNEYDLNPEYRAEVVKRLPDEFAFLQDTKDPEIKQAIDDIFHLGPAFFVGNDSHGNVLSYSFDNDQFIMSQFFGNIKELYYNTAVRYSPGLAPPIDGSPSSETRREKLYSLLDQISKYGFYGNSMAKIFGSTDWGPMDKVRLADDLADIMYMDSVGVKRYSPKGRRSGELSLIMLFMSLFKHSYRGHISTVPMFEISNMGVLGTPAIVLLKSTGRVKPFSEQNRSTTDFFSGLYRILGFRHSISTTSAKSEFIMYKDVQGVLGSE